MADISTSAARRAGKFPFDQVRTCKIHPGIGIARVGNSREYFIGPETPCYPRDAKIPEGGYKDKGGRIKRQAARFRIYAYDEAGKNLGELPLGGAKQRAAGRAAQVEWTVELANKKGAWYKFYSQFEQPDGIRNADIPICAGEERPDSRAELVIKPGARCIDGEGNPVGSKPDARRVDKKGKPVGRAGLSFDTGTFRGTRVPLGELAVDSNMPDGTGRLLVLGGFGKSASIKSDHPIGSDPSKYDYWANNDFWYDDISDGPVTAKVTLPHRKEPILIDRAEDAAWVIVAPPKYAPGVYPVVTLYDVIREVHVDAGWIPDDPNVEYYRDIYPILLRAAEHAWVNDEGRRGHGYDKRGDFHIVETKADDAQQGSAGTKISAVRQGSSKLATADEAPRLEVRRKVTTALAEELAAPASSGSAADRQRIFNRIRKPLPDGSCDPQHADGKHMPPLSGDGGDRTEGNPKTWLMVLLSQYRKFEQWKNGHSEVDRKPTFPPLEDMAPNDQTKALQRAALEPCVGGAFYPGIEATWIVRNKDLYVRDSVIDDGGFRINSEASTSGDITKYMALPWQADFYDCKDTWWPAARPDDVIPQHVFEEANKAWRDKEPKLSEALEGRVKWDRGLAVTTLFRRPWNNPASTEEDPRDTARRGCDDMVRYWHELGFVVPCKTRWHDDKKKDEIEIVQVEMDRRPHAGMDVRDLFHCLLNIEKNRSCLPKVREFVDNVLEAARRLQQSADAFAFMDNIRPFTYCEEAFDARMNDIYDDCADFAFTQTVNKVRVPFNANDAESNPYFRSRENVVERIRQLAPFNFVDGSWLRNIHRIGPVDEVNSLLFSILQEELGDGVPSQNHANIYCDLCHSFGFYPPPINTSAFAFDPSFLDAAFDSPAFQMGISEFSERYYPEIIGMTLWLEWTVLDLHRISAIVERVGLSSHFYRMHIAIDNAASGHAARIVRAIKLYLAQKRTEGGEKAVQCHWNRIWDGYVAFAHTFAILIQQVIYMVTHPPSLERRLKELIKAKAPYGRYNHTRKKLGDTNINSLFLDPDGFLRALQEHGYIIAGQPDASPFFKLLEFRGGPMYHVFTEDEIKLWRDWTLELAEVKVRKRGVARLRERLTAIDPPLAQALSNADLAKWQAAAADHRIALWVEIAIAEIPRRQPNPTPQEVQAIVDCIDVRFKNWLGSGMIRAVTYIAARRSEGIENVTLRVYDEDTNSELLIANWFERIREAPNSAGPARAFLKSLGPMLTGNPELLNADAPVRYAFESGIPGNDRRTARETREAWVKAGCPLPDVSSDVQALRLDASLAEHESHPTGVVMGHGTVH